MRVSKKSISSSLSESNSCAIEKRDPVERLVVGVEATLGAELATDAAVRERDERDA